MIMMLAASVIKVVDRVDGRKTRRGVVPSMMRMLTKKSMIKIIVALIIDNFDNFDYFDFQLLLGWVWVAREQILRRAR